MLGGSDDEEVTALDRHVAPGLRLWMLIALISGVLLIMVVLVCCFMKIRIPRTKREIELMSAKRRLRKQRGNLPAQDVSEALRSQTIVMHSLNVPGGQLVAPTSSEAESSYAESTEDEKSALSATPSGTHDRMLPLADERAEFLRRTQLERDKRELEQKREATVVKIQSVVRTFLVRRKLGKEIRTDFDALFARFVDLDKSSELPPVVNAFKTGRSLFLCYDWNIDRERLAQLCRYLIISCDSVDAKTSCVSLSLSKEHIGRWARFLRILMWECCTKLPLLQADKNADLKLIGLLLHTLVCFSTCNGWALLKGKQGEALKPALNQFCAKIVAQLVANGMYAQLATVLFRSLCRKKASLRPETLKALVVILLRPLLNENFSEERLCDFVVSVLTAPALLIHLSQECTALLLTNDIFERTINVLVMDRYSRRVFDRLDGVTSLNLLANLIHMSTFDRKVMVENLLDFTNVVSRLLEKCHNYVVVSGKKSQTNHWHPIFGWYSQRLDEGVQCTMPLISTQLQHLWSKQTVQCLFRDLISMIPVQDTPQSSDTSANGKDLSASVRNLLRKIGTKQQFNAKIFKRFGTPEATLTALVCSLYQSALSTFVQLHTDILSGLCREDFLLPKLWRFIASNGTDNGLKAYLDLLAENQTALCPEFAILTLFCDGASCIISILDETELYEQQKPFTIDELTAMAKFGNIFCFRVVWDGIIDRKSWTSNALFNAVYHLTMVIYNRDCRRNFIKDPKFWLIKESRSSSLMSDFEKNNEKAVFLLQRMPHIVPHKERVVLFRKYVRADKEANGLLGEDIISTLITVQRGRIIEDGYRQLSQLNNNTLKGVIRVKFVNEQGLDEAGIDQDGVFKEFLEQTIQKVFDPGLNLFKSTDEGRLYASPTSAIHENHLALFDFVGRMLGKAMYEGIVVDVAFTSSFLASLLGRRFSPFDELSSLDPDLYKSLTFVKHYDGDVSDLELTFSVDEEVMGQMCTFDLLPGGRTIQVTNENKISYVHKMASFRVVERTREQTRAFVGGFQSIISASWLSLFSPQELQKLISGDSDDIDMADMRRHTQYYGGFHNNHRLINWLWDVLEHDFTAEERRLFLKFVTSCSKPPLLGFAHLEPAFSIRCVEVSDDQDQGDTLGSVIRGFLALKRREPAGRLPTASTCFNLLKLPNYQKKSTLREKLKYAIHSGTGFELS